MKKYTTILAIGSGLLLGQAQAEIESEFHVGYNSQYVFRGIDLGDDAYEYGLDFSGSGNCGLDWSAGIWGVSPDGEDGNVDELDIYAAVSKDFGVFAVSTGFNAYTYPNGGLNDDSEVFLGVSGEAYGFELGAKAFFGTDGQFEDQILIEGSIGYAHKLSDTLALNAGFIIGYIADDGQGVYADDEGMAYYSATVSLDVALSEDITFSPYVAFIDADGGTINSVSYPDAVLQDGLIGGARIGFKF